LTNALLKLNEITTQQAMHNVLFLLILENKLITMKRLFIFLFISIISFGIFSQAQEAPKVKYAFLFIGDGMGLAEVNLTQAYLASKDSIIGFQPLTFTQFPEVGLVTTYSNSDFITCSSAAGTALASGNKTDNGKVSLSPDKKVIYKTIAETAKEKGKRVGIVTSVSLDHATPAVFYAHQPSRDMYFEIGYQLVTSNFDYFAGGGFKDPVKTVNGKEVNLMKVAKDNGFNLVDDLEGYNKLMKSRQKTIVMSPKLDAEAAMPYSIDMGTEDLTLEDLTATGIMLLEGPEGFFMMVEGGKIDWAGHGNDAVTSIHEVTAFDQAVAAALSFYNMHPEETIIVVTSDHETGGLALGNRDHELNLAALHHQKISLTKLNDLMMAMKEKKSGDKEEDFQTLLQLLNFNLGLGSATYQTELTAEEQQLLKDAMIKSIYKDEISKGLYSDDSPVAQLALKIMADKAGISWGTGDHTFIAVPVYAIGPGSEEFSGFMDNTEIPKKLMKVMGIQ
jgi:alkaline phosphatase